MYVNFVFMKSAGLQGPGKSTSAQTERVALCTPATEWGLLQGWAPYCSPSAAVLRGSQAMSAGSVALFWATLLTCTDVWPSNRHEVLTTVLPAFSLAFGWWCEKAWAEPGCFLSEEGGKKYTPKSLIQRLATAWQDTTEFSVAQIYTVIPKLQTT